MSLSSERSRRSDHNEAVRLAFKARHVPFGTIVITILILACVLSAILEVIALGPSNPIP
jgi:hypothetical protein